MPGAQCTRSLVRAGSFEYAPEHSQRRHRKHPAFPTRWIDSKNPIMSRLSDLILSLE
jgi:hypothetical protein